ncbi:MAG: DEAD/DEAH box helicase [Methylococcaceae bacterium]
MNPSVLAQQLQQAVKDYLRLTFETTTPFFEGLLERFLGTEGALAKGPYLSIKLPFEKGQGKADFFPAVPMAFSPHKHQEIAFQRIGVDFKSTLVATGTGSGKTECFQLPILDYCYQHRGQKGIKAILIYPMNALAADQAQRLAKAIADNPNLKNTVTAGIYVGDKEQHATTNMAREHLISDKDTLRNDPPDILLTNYKMLDFLLIRAKDHRLWVNNTETTLKFLVVDELHTFDGAQGTDLACLIRRLKARMETPKQHLVCVGTSATLGGQDAGQNLITYATSVFDEYFDEQAVITEYRQSLGDYLAPEPVEYVGYPTMTQLQALKADNYSELESYALAQAQLWFEQLAGFEDANLWRVELAKALKRHYLFQNLLRLLKGQVTDWTDLLAEFKKCLGSQNELTDELVEQLLISLVSLISVAREHQAGYLAPLLDVRMQLWLRELSRLVVLLPTKDEQPKLLFSDDGLVPKDRIALPAIHCRDCGAMGFVAHKEEAEQSKINTDLQQIYKSYFSHSPKVSLLFPMDKVETPWNFASSLDKNLCTGCGYLNNRSQLSCQNCGDESLVWVHQPNNIVLQNDANLGEANNLSHNNCPFCQSKGSLLIVGARSTSLSSVMVGQLSTSRFNRDKQLIAFSDGVQDTAHRAGFIAARTRSYGFRVALKQVLDQAKPDTSLTEIIKQFNLHWLTTLGEAAFIGTFLPLSMEWLRDYSFLIKNDKLPDGSNLSSLLQQRLAFEILSELGFKSRIGRSLERSGSVASYYKQDELELCLQGLLNALQEHIGTLRELSYEQLQRFVLGFLAHLRIGGGIYSPDLESYIHNNGDPGVFFNQRALPNFSYGARVPTFLSSKKSKGLETVASGQANVRNWYQTWVLKTLLASDDLQPTGDFNAAIYQLTLQHLLKAQLLVDRSTKTNDTVWGINPERLLLSTQVATVCCKHCQHSHSVADSELAVWIDSLCLQKNCIGHYQLNKASSESLDFYGRLYRDGEVNRVVTAEHTGLLTRDERSAVEKSFKKTPENRKPWDVNLLSATPTLEMGVDIGDLSLVLLCSVPPAQANYLQRIGRAGRRDGNALNVTLANANAHDLYFYSDPIEMMAGEVEAPGVFLDASAVLERQYTAFCLDKWVKKYAELAVIPLKLKEVLRTVSKGTEHSKAFPYSFLNEVEIHRDDLIEQFLELFNSGLGAGLSTFSVDWLKRFAEGDFETQGSLSFRIQEILMQQYLEVESMSKETKRVNTVLKTKKSIETKSQQDEKEIEDLEHELTALQSVVNNIKNQDTLQFLTDEGLIPNYAFPEQGVILHSVIYRSKKDNDGAVKAVGVDKESERWTYKYERPAASALSELAPSSIFYAGGRRVEINRVDLRVSQKETWRLCPACHHSECIDTGDAHQTCPRCGDRMWVNISQKQTMLRLKQVYATTADRNSRISDDKDDRDSQFFTKQLLIDFEDAAITAAYKVDKVDWPFGFEFISKADFREINTGHSDENSPEITIAGKESKRTGFKLCQHCGMVQVSTKKPKEQVHTISCTTKNKDNENNIISGLFLYREFQSEAIRILLPITSGTDADSAELSFIAALQLGLKKKFGGSIDHLRVAQNIEPDPEDKELSKRYLVIYDSVPGGTGYLKQLTSHQDDLIEVLTEYAMPVLEKCSCVQKEHADGCYRCLYVYKNSRNITSISRKKARDFIKTLKENAGKIVPVASLRDIKMSPLVESELEARFLEALRKTGKALKKENKISDFEWRAEFYAGEAGWYLRLGQQRYFIRRQVELGAEQQVAIQSRADFVMVPLGNSELKPIVIFTDGFKYHKDRVALDTAQRMAIVASNHYWVWSLSYEDVQNVLDDKTGLPIDLLLGSPNVKAKQWAEHFSCVDLLGLHDQSSFTWLIALLLQGCESVWQRYSALLSFIWFREMTTAFDPASVQSLPEYAQLKLDGIVDSAITKVDRLGTLWGDSYQRLELSVRLDTMAFNQKDFTQLSTNLVFDDSADLIDFEADLKQWQSFLRLINVLQFQPHSGFYTQKGIDSFAYDNLMMSLSEKVNGPIDGIIESAWELILADAVGTEVALINQLIPLNLPIPQCGFELLNESGEIIAEAFLAWLDYKVVIVLEGYDTDTATLTEKDWQVFLNSELDKDLQALLTAFALN